MQLTELPLEYQRKTKGAYLWDTLAFRKKLFCKRWQGA